MIELLDDFIRGKEFFRISRADLLTQRSSAE
jgi:hypothetical protein